VVSVVAVGVAVASWFRPAPEPALAAKPSYTESEIDNAKKQVCDAFNLAHEAIVVAGNKQDPNDFMAFAANGRLSFFAGAQYLSDVLSDNPATPQDVTSAARDYALTYKQLSLVLLADQTADKMDQSIVKAGDAANDKLKQACQ